MYYMLKKMQPDMLLVQTKISKKVYSFMYMTAELVKHKLM